MFIRAANLLLRVLSPLIRLWENIGFCREETEAPPPIFIVGAPRTGSTILYQALTNCYQFGFIDNTVCTWHRNLRFGFWLSKRKYGDSPHDNFQSEHGNTSQYGGHAPSECGQFWYRWLPRDRHFIDYEDIDLKMVSQIRREVIGSSSYLNRPLLFKNLNAGQRLRLINVAFPDAKIIFLRRDPRFVLRSVLKARKNLGVAPGKLWSVMPRNADDLLGLTEAEMCAAQIYHLEHQIEQDLSLFPEQNVQIIHYRALNGQLLDRLALWCGVPVRLGTKNPNFQKDDSSLIPSEEREALERVLGHHPFNKDLFD